MKYQGESHFYNEQYQIHGMSLFLGHHSKESAFFWSRKQHLDEYPQEALSLANKKLKIIRKRWFDDKISIVTRQKILA